MSVVTVSTGGGPGGGGGGGAPVEWTTSNGTAISSTVAAPLSKTVQRMFSVCMPAASTPICQPAFHELPESGSQGVLRQTATRTWAESRSAPSQNRQHSFG